MQVPTPSTTTCAGPDFYGLLTHLGYDGDPSTMLTHCEQAEAEAAHADDPLADLAGRRSLHAVRGHGREHAPQRLELAVVSSASRRGVVYTGPQHRVVGSALEG